MDKLTCKKHPTFIVGNGGKCPFCSPDREKDKTEYMTCDKQFTPPPSGDLVERIKRELDGVEFFSDGGLLIPAEKSQNGPSTYLSLLNDCLTALQGATIESESKAAFWAAFEVARMNPGDNDIQKHWEEWKALEHSNGR